MVKFFVNAVFCFTILSGSASFAQSASTETIFRDVLVPNEVSALLISSDYASAVEVQVEKARALNKELRIARFDVLKFGTTAFVYAFLATRELGTADWTTAGQLVGNVSYSQSGEALIKGVYFKPDGSGPGGASVGN